LGGGAGAGFGGGGGGGALATGGGSGLGSGLAAGLSSSAMIRRMEARISSIEGSCAFAACVIRRFPLAFRLGTATTANQPWSDAICEDSPEYGTRKVERKQSPVDRIARSYNGLIRIDRCLRFRT
jgi:hypothetical protein